MFGYIIQSFAYNFIVLWILFILSPCYILLASGMGKIYLQFHHYLQQRGTYIYHYLGDISWLIPFKTESDLKSVNVLLIANLLALLSILVIASMFWSFYTETQTKKLEALKKADIAGKEKEE